MIVSYFSFMIWWQLNLTTITKNINKNIIAVFGFAATTTMNLAYWFFALSYLAISYTIEDIIKKKTKSTYYYHLNTLNIIVCLFNVIVPTVVWVFRV